MGSKPQQIHVLEVYFGGERIVGTSQPLVPRQVDLRIKNQLNISDSEDDAPVIFLVPEGEEKKFQRTPLTGQYSLQPEKGGLVVRRLPVDWE